MAPSMAPSPAPARPRGEAAFCWALVLAGAFISWQATGIGTFDSPSAAGAVPLAAGLVMTGGALAAVLEAGRRARGSGPILPRDVAVLGGLVLAYMAGLEALGFLLASFLFLLAGIGWLQRGRLLRAALVAGVTLALIWLVFRLLFRVLLPPGWIFA